MKSINMEQFNITGPIKLSGKVKVSGSKNEALKIIPLAVILNKPVKVKNVPKIKDIASQIEIFRFLGGSADFAESLKLDSKNIKSHSIVCNASKSLRASVVYLGPLLSKFKKAQLPFPGGCAIGLRPIDTHLRAFADLGAEISCCHDVVSVAIDKIKNNKITLAEKSVSATENIVLFLASQEQKVEISNCAIEPEIIHLIGILNEAGAKIKKIGERCFEVWGNKNLSLQEIEVMPDRIEAGTFLIAFAATGGEGEIEPFRQDQVGSLIDVLRQCGVTIKIKNGVCLVKGKDIYKPFKIKTGPYPEFPTDLQSPMSLLAANARGVSIIKEEMFENRLNYLENLGKMGLQYRLINNNYTEITGPVQLKGATVLSTDLRAGITILIAGIMAKGQSVIRGADIIDRGYEDVENKLSQLGAKITRSDV